MTWVSHTAGGTLNSTPKTLLSLSLPTNIPMHPELSTLQGESLSLMLATSQLTWSQTLC